MEPTGSTEASTSRNSAKKKNLDSWFEAMSRNSTTWVGFDDASPLLFAWTGDKEWAENPKLYFMLRAIDREDLFPKLLAAHITDFWIPFSKHMVKRLLEEPDRRHFLDAQRLCLDEDIPTALEGQHFSFEDSDSMKLEEVKPLGAGGYGEVHHVNDPRTGKAYARKIMRRPIDFKRQCELMKNFRKELMGMRRVRHRHCVDLVATCTDADSVVLLCSPVADMDLAVYLDRDLSMLQLGILRQAVGCITSALAYLHELNIRHDDLKPNNILIHGSTILLTDFGFCLDFSDSASSTTTGAPTHHSQRYSAPEVFDREPRSRLTDVWGLGCVLIEIVSRLRGYKLSALRSFWRLNGIQYDSFAKNQEATTAWIAKLTNTPTRTQHGTERRDLWLTSFIYHTLLEPNRLLRPTVKQILEKLQDLDFIYPVEPMQCWVAGCCATTTNLSTSSSPFHGTVPQWPILDLMSSDDHLAYLFFDTDLQVFAHSKNLSFLDKVNGSRAHKLERLLASGREREVVRDAVRSMLTSHSAPSHDDADFPTFLSQILSSISTGCLKDVSFWVDFLNIYVEGTDKIPRIRTVQLSFHTICLERQPGYGRPFLVMAFDPEEGEMKQEEVDNPEHNPKLHIDRQKFGYEPPKLVYFRREHRDVWTDGLGVAAVFSDWIKKETYASFQTLVSERRRNFLKLLNQRRTVQKGFERTKCTRCTEYDLKCDGPLAGVCSHCQKASARCGFNIDAVQRGGAMRKYIDEHAYQEDLITVRWGS